MVKCWVGTEVVGRSCRDIDERRIVSRKSLEIVLSSHYSNVTLEMGRESIQTNPSEKREGGYRHYETIFMTS